MERGLQNVVASLDVSKKYRRCVSWMKARYWKRFSGRWLSLTLKNPLIDKQWRGAEEVEGIQLAVHLVFTTLLPVDFVPGSYHGIDKK